MRATSALRAAFAVIALCVPAHTATAQDSTDPIKIALNDWTGQLISSQLMGQVLQKAGYSVEYVQADYLAQFAGLETGDLSLAMEIWATTGQEALEAAVATGKVENLGETGMLAKEEWWFPEYMKEVCPGLPDWHALLEPSCAEAFSTAETAPNGRYLSGPVTWGGFDEERVSALKLPFEVVHAGTDAALFAELESAYQRKAPIILWLYAPHWAPAKFAGDWVAFPPYSPECYADPAVGENAGEAYDCGKPSGPVWKAGWAGLKDKWPHAYEIIKVFNVSNEDMGALIASVDLDGASVEQVAADWLAGNESKWKGWVE